MYLLNVYRKKSVRDSPEQAFALSGGRGVGLSLLPVVF